MAAVLLQALERTELNKLPKGVQNKLEKFVTELQDANQELRTQHERFRADCGRWPWLLGHRNGLLRYNKEFLCQTVKHLKSAL